MSSDRSGDELAQGKKWKKKKRKGKKKKGDCGLEYFVTSPRRGGGGRIKRRERGKGKTGLAWLNRLWKRKLKRKEEKKKKKRRRGIFQIGPTGPDLFRARRRKKKKEKKKGGAKVLAAFP